MGDGYTEKTRKAMNKQKECPAAKQDQGKQEQSVATFSKKQLLESNWYSHRRDMLNALLDDDKTYSHAQVQYLMDTFMKGRVDE